jgi:hypothetical protein
MRRWRIFAPAGYFARSLFPNAGGTRNAAVDAEKIAAQE